MSRANSRSGLFARFSLDYADHPKIMSLSDAAFRLHVSMILYSRKYETDGVINNRVANRLASQWDHDVIGELLTNDFEAPSLTKLSTGDYLLHGYADMNETKAEISARRKVNAANGARGGRPRKTQPKTHSVTDSVSETVDNSVSDSGSEKKAESETETDKELPNGSSLKSLFERAYAAWPKKVERRKSQEKFNTKARLFPDPTELVELIERHADAYARYRDKQYTPALNVWLNGERWTDELVAPQAVDQYSGGAPTQRPTRMDRADAMIGELERMEGRL